ncbi:MAG: tetratricopeptide repeat protein [Dokdonella sp.]
MRYQFDQFIFDGDNAQLSGPDGEIALRPITVQVLRYLLENAQRLIGHEELLDEVWGRQAVSVGVVSQSIRELRQALGDSARNSIYIETKHKLGYRFIAQPQLMGEVASIEQRMQANSAPRAESMARATTPAKPANYRLGVAIAALVLSALIAIVWIYKSTRTSAEERAWATIEPLHEGRPREPEALAWYAQGLEALRHGNLLSAHEKLDRSLKREPASAAAMVAMAEVLAQSGNLLEAREWVKSAADWVASLPRASQLRLEGFRAGLDYRHADEIAAWQALHKLDPGDSDAGFHLLDALINAGRRADAEHLLDQLSVQQAPALDGPRLALMSAKLAALRGDHHMRVQAAQEALAKAGNDTERIDALLELAMAELLGGRMPAIRQTLERADNLLITTPLPRAQLRRQMIAATLLRVEGQYAESIATFDAVEKSAASLGQRKLIVEARREAAFVMSEAGDQTKAISALKSVRDEQTPMGDPRALASTLDVLSIVEQRVGDLTAAEASAQAALQAYLDAGDLTGEASARNTLGMLHARSGRAADAQEQWEKALALFVGNADRRGEATARSNLAILYARAGRVDAARDANEAALVAFKAVDSTPDIARLQFNLGVQDRRAGRIRAAETRFREALDAFTQIGAEDSRLQVVASLGELLLLRADLDGAASLLSAVEFSERTAVSRRAAIETARAREAALRGENETAGAGFRLALQLRQQAGLTDWARMSELDLAELAARQGQLGDAEQSARELRRAMLEAKDAHAGVQAGVLLAGALSAQGRDEHAGNTLDDLEKELLDNPDALLTLRVDLLRASLRDADRRGAFEHVAARARDVGFELLALRADLLADGANAENARTELGRRGVAVNGMPPPIPY